MKAAGLVWPGALLVALALAACGQRREPAEDQAHTIVVGGEVNHEAVHEFSRTSGRRPTREDLLTVHRVWIDNEILYREGSQQGFGKSSGREQVIFQALAKLDEGLEPVTATDDELRRWFESHREKYEQPARYDFEDAVASRDEAVVRALVQKLNASPANVPDGVRAFTGRPTSNLAQSYGAEVAAALAKAPLRTWQVLRAGDGWHALRVTAVAAGQQASFDAQRDAVRRDLIESKRPEQRERAMQALRKSYKVEFATTYECHADK